MLVELLGKKVTVKVDRPIGSKHPNYETIYELNYGYIDNVIAGDGDYADAYILGQLNPIKEFTGIVIAIIKRFNDIEDKLVVSNINYSKHEIFEFVNFQEKYFKIKIVMANEK